MIKKLCLVLLLCASAVPAAWAAFSPFAVKDIRVEGLERIDAGTVFNYLPLSIGETIDDAKAQEAVRALFKTGFFQDVALEREDDVLVVKVKERPAIGEIKFSGNKEIQTDDLKEALKKLGLAEGRIFDRSLLDKMERELSRQYFSRGKYGVKITSEVKPLDRNRVAISLTLSEGEAAKIKEITLVGNRAYGSEELLGRFQLSPSTFFSFLSKNDQYSKQKLAADLEGLRSFYLDRGYINFNIDSTQVSITPDKQGVYITINVTEGDKYIIKDVALAGELIVPEQELRALTAVHAGDVFSRKSTAETAAGISDRLGKEGYAFANVNTIPEVDEADKTVKLTFYVDPGKRVYVRRINIGGNIKTQDVVLRREVRQMEGGWISTEKINRSRVRLQKLGYFEDVNVETPPVPGTTDEVDVNFDVNERNSFGSLMAGVGYSGAQGVLFNASVTQDNFLGSGKQVSARLDNSKVNTVYSFSYTDPYYTLDGISRGFKLFYRQTDAGNANVASYLADSHGGSVNFGIPMNEFDTTRVSLGYKNTLLKTSAATPQAYLDFINANSDAFDTFDLSVDWSHDTRNKAFFPERGILESLSMDTTLPGSGLNYYKLANETSWYYPVSKDVTLLLGAELAYGDRYGETSDFPFFERYYAGGIHSVRGFRANTLGPRDAGNPVGGALRTTGNLEFIFPPPFTEKNNSFRMSAFADVGNVYSGFSAFDAGELKYSAGISAVWLSPIGPLTFSFAKPFNVKLTDETEFFQFSIGAIF